MKLFKFPKYDSPLFAKWVDSCNLSAEFIEHSPLLFLCEKHFSLNLLGKKFLKRGAIPNLNLKDGQTPNENDLEINNKEEISLSLLESPTRKRKRSESPGSLCRFCHKSLKTLEFYKKKCGQLMKQLANKTKRIEILKKENSKLKKTVARNEERNQKVEERIPDDAVMQRMDINENEKTICKMLLKSERGNNASWSPDEKLLAQNLYHKSSSTYLFLRNVLKINLPSPSSISRWNIIKNVQPGLNLCIMNALKNTAHKMDQRDRECILILDVISIKHNLSYNSTADVIDGLVDLGYERSNKLGGQICVFMIRGLFKNWKFIIQYVVLEKSISTNVLTKVIKDFLPVIDNIGFKVRAITSDQGPNNRKCYANNNCFKATVEKPYFIHENRKIYLLFDVPHLIKSIRNILLKGDLQTPDGVVKFDVIREIFELENGNVTKMTKLTSKHIAPNTFERMRVNLAAQTLSHSVASAIESATENNQLKRNEKEIAYSTAKFITKIDTLFDCLNSKVVNDPNPFRRALKKENIVWNKLKELLVYIKQIKYTGNKIYCLDGLIQTINGILSLTEDIFREQNSY